MKNILMIATFFPPMGGIGVMRVTKFIKYLKEYGWNPIVLTVSEKYVVNRDESLLNDIKDVKLYRTDFKKHYKDISMDFYFAAKKEIKKIMETEKIDAVFITGGPFNILPIGRYIYDKYKIPYIIDLRDPWKLQKLLYNNKIGYIKQRIKRSIKGVMERHTFKHASAILTVNDTVNEQYCEEYKKYKDKIYTIPNGYDYCDYKDIEPKKFDKFTIVYSGKFDVSVGFRNPTDLFKVISKLNKEGKDIQFIHVGNEEDKVIKIAEQEGIKENSEFVGFKSFKETISYSKGADLLAVICSDEKSEQTGKIFDYIACEKPIIVISNKISEVNKVCDGFDNIYKAKHGNLQEIEEAVMDVYNKEGMSSRKDLEKSRYSRYTLTGKLVKILEKI